MQTEYFISLWLDTRRKKKSGKYPVKLRVFTKNPRKQKLYPTRFEFSKQEFESIYGKSSLRDQKKKEIQLDLESIEIKAKEAAEKLNPFTIEQFEKNLLRNDGDGIKIKYQYNQAINKLNKRDQLGTAETYTSSEKSIIRFMNHNKLNYSKLTFYDVTPDWLESYEDYLTKTEKKSITTVSMYVRCLRTIFNTAIDDNEIKREIYPFGKRKYKVPSHQTVKKSLNQEQLKKLFESNPETPEQEKAKDFWFLSYACNGMNIKDIALMKYKDIKEGKIEFLREKTRRTAKTKLKPVIVYLNDFTQSIFDKYKIDQVKSDSFVFDIINPDMTPKQQQKAIKNFTRFINQHIKKLCKKLKLSEISVQWARHSFATNAIRQGATMEFMQESLGHQNISTTQNYFEGFDDESKKEFSKSIMDFK